MQHVVILHHHEITLKGDNRRFFEQMLLRNIRAMLRGIVSPDSVRGGYGRSVIEIHSTENLGAVVEKLSRVFGIANICSGVKVEQNIEVFCKTAAKLLDGSSFSTIKIHTRRPDKSFPVRSMDVNVRVGEYICRKFGVRANLEEPDETIYIEIADGNAYVYRSKLKGAGGLPVGVSGRVVSLLSAGFDSPVASWQMIKRGASVIFTHFHSMPYTTVESLNQVRRLAQLLAQYQFTSKLYIVPFADIQNEIVLRAAQSLRIILYRRMMVRIAEAVAHREKAEALVTGEAIGQVASQTLRNIRIIDAASTLPILRPLSGMDKEETMAIARSIGTFDTSAEPYDDCCSFLAPRKPATWSNPEEVEAAESKLDIHCMIARGMETTTTEIFSELSIHYAKVVTSSSC